VSIDLGCLDVRNVLVAGSAERLNAELVRQGVKDAAGPALSFGCIRIVECRDLPSNKVYFIDEHGNVARAWTLPEEKP
jgi:hypothetical protein